MSILSVLNSRFILGLFLTIIIQGFVKVSGNIASSSAKYCAIWREIQPCSCTINLSPDQDPIKIILCENMASFGDIVALLKDKFSPTDRISLRINFSNLNDLYSRSFKELNMTIVNLKLDHNGLR
ncbi:hypothetical protein QE152_g37170 [Popillia japonica]|uniref:Uncharacterized protein n=1 Tax=Popillia japonica TaxID=7064 RepID=A0AAW1IB20_POPJA